MMFYKYWHDYIDFLDSVMHIPLEGLKQMQKGSFDLIEMLKNQLNAQNEALLDCYRTKRGEPLAAIPFMNIMIFEGGKVLFDSVDTRRIKELHKQALNAGEALSGFPIDVGRRIGEFIPNPKPSSGPTVATAQKRMMSQAHS